MNAYLEMKERHQKEFNSFPMKFAFSDKQFEEGMRELGLEPTDTDKVYKFGGTGGFYRRSDAEQLHEMLKRHSDEEKAAIEADTDGTGYAYEMFYYEFGNHEYSYTYDVEDTIRALGYESVEEIKENPQLYLAYTNAKRAYEKYHHMD